MKTCNNCKEEKDISNFYANGYTPKGTKKYKPNCKKCSLELVNTNHRNRLHKILTSQDRKYECEVCGYNKNYAALSFHHLIDEKNFEINNGRSVSYERLDYEVSICKVLCQNCHCEVHNPTHVADEVNRT